MTDLLMNEQSSVVLLTFLMILNEHVGIICRVGR